MTMRSNEELVQALRKAPESWMETAIVVAFENRFEFVPEDHPNPAGRLTSLEQQGGLAIGLAGIEPTACNDRAFLARVFKEYEDQAWAQRYMDRLRGLVACYSAR